MSIRTIIALLIGMASLAGQAQPLSDAFNQGAALGRSGNTAARTQINGNTAQSSVPGYTTNPPQTSYFRQPGISTPAAAAANACTGPGDRGDYAAQACNAVRKRRVCGGRSSSDRLNTTAASLFANAISACVTSI